jgi:SpoIID/LytB domain protein
MEPTISVGVLSAQKIAVVFHSSYVSERAAFAGQQEFVLRDGKIYFAGKSYNELLFSPQQLDASFDLLDVVIGIGFHWEREETQRFNGQLKIIVEGDKLTAVNVLPVEDYLLSVISSEMSATSSLELLKAHAVTSRSWLLAQLEAKKKTTSPPTPLQGRGEENHIHEFITPPTEGAGESLIRWYDKDDHVNFDVCADDHCQRYQGITRASAEAVKEAIDATRGQVLKYEEKICDARFSKCCGGIAELFENCWEPRHHAYLLPVEDKPEGGVSNRVMTEAEIERFIKNPVAGDFCNTTDARVLSQVLNSYDQETPDFYRWQVSYTQAEIAELLARRSGIDFGSILDLIPVERGISGRLIRLKIVGSKRSITVGKELEIRKWLSNSHLYSSAFIVEKGEVQHGVPAQFTLLGAGWGHGVGLCQIGAAVMAEKGYLYKAILKHYFRNAELKKIY